MTSRSSASRRLRLALIVGASVLALGACTSGSDETVDPGTTSDAPPSTETTGTETTATTEATPRPPAPTIPRPPVTPGEPLAPDACTKGRLRAAYNDQSGADEELETDRINSRRCRDPFAALFVEPAFFDEGSEVEVPDLLLFAKDTEGWRFLGSLVTGDEERCVELGAPASLCRP